MSDMNGSKHWVIDKIFPTSEVHLVGGPSGSGKTSWIFQMIEDWKAGRPVLGMPSFPTNFIYVSCDRSNKSVDQTMTRVKTKFPCFSIIDANMVGKTYVQIINAIIPDKNPEPTLLVIDGFTSLCPNGKINDYQVVSMFLAHLTRLCQEKNLTVIGLVHTSKTKEGERILNPRQKIVGSTAWAAYSDTIVIIEPMDATDEGSKRVLEVMPRNSKHVRRLMQFTETGQLVEIDGEADMVAAEEFVLDQHMSNFEAGQEVPTQFFMDVGEGNKIPRRTTERWVANQVKAGKLEHVKKGTYRVPYAN